MTRQRTKEVRVIRPTIGLNTDERLRVAAYCRVSTDSADQANSFIAQVKYYNDFIRISDNMVLVDIYADEGITGTSVNKREEFKRMLKDCKAGKIDRIFVKSVSRFARNSLECIENIRLLKTYGASVLFENDGIDSESMNSEMILYIKSAFAQSEALAGSKRVSTAYRMKMENGELCTYHAPFGYRFINKKLTPIPEEAEIVKRIFNDFLSGDGVGKIVAQLNAEEGMIGKPWGQRRVRYILTNEKYIGDCLLQKTYTPHTLPLRNIQNRGEVDKYYASNTHEPIIDKHIFESSAVLLQKKRDKYDNYGKAQKHNFSKKLSCGDCGWSYKRRVQNGIVYWVCSRHGTAGRRCKTHNLTEENICRSFMLMYNRLRQNEKEILDFALSNLIALRNRITSGNSEIGEIDREIAELSEQNSMYTRLRAKDIMDEVSYMEQTSALQRRMTELRGRRSKLLSEDEEERCIEELRKLKEQLLTLPTALLQYDHAIFDALVSKATVEVDDSIVFELHSGLKLRERAIWN